MQDSNSKDKARDLKEIKSSEREHNKRRPREDEARE